MREIKVKGCEDCPFYYIDQNEYAVGYDTIDRCILQEYLSGDNWHYQMEDIRIYNSYPEEDIPPLVTPEWCPLKKEPFKITKR